MLVFAVIFYVASLAAIILLYVFFTEVSVGILEVDVNNHNFL